MTQSLQSYKPLLYILFFLSGFSGLIYESIWSHYIKLMLGHAAYAQTLVLVIFMGGMALGAWLVSRISIRIKNPLMAYAVVEAIVGLFGIFFHQEFIWIKQLVFSSLLPAIDSATAAQVAKWFCAALLLLPQSILLGTTFPLMSTAIIRLNPERSGYTLGMLYFSNSIGAVLGVLVSGFYLIEAVGLPGTSFTAGLINIVILVLLAPLARRLSSGNAIAASKNQTTADPTTRLLLIIAFITGMASFLYEIAWIRMLSLVLGSSNQAFELMLSAFILGLALGSFYIRHRVDKIKDVLVYLASVQILMAVAATATLPLYMYSFDIMALLRSALTYTNAGYVIFNFGSHLIASSVMVPATFLAGMTLPLITHALLRLGKSESSIGWVYASNTLGAITGIIIGINLLMPLSGTKSLIIVGGLLDLFAGIALIMVFRKTIPRTLNYGVAALAALVVIITFSFTQFDKAILSSGVYRYGPLISPDRESLFYRDGKTATIAVNRFKSGKISIETNGKTDASINPDDKPSSADEITMALSAALPLAIKPDARNVANIGMGSGMTVQTLLASKSIERVDTIEIEQAMVDGAKFFGKRVDRAYSDPRSFIHIDDAKSFFSTNKNTFDIIVSEPSNPWVSGVASLFTEEFYYDVQRYLNPGGIFVQWLQLYETNLNNVASVLKALDKQFSDYAIYNTDNANILIVASNDSISRHLDTSLFDDADMAKELKRVNVESIADLNIRWLGNKATLSPFFSEIGAPVNSDYFPFLSYQSPKSFFKKETAVELTNLHTAPIPLLATVGDKTIPEGASTEGKKLDIYNYLRAANATINFDFGSINQDQVRHAAIVIERALVRCEEDPVQKGYIRDALLTLAMIINPYKGEQQASSFWDQLQEGCISMLSKTNRQWFDLHSAISKKEFTRTSNIAINLFNNAEALQEKEVFYLAAAALAADYVNNDHRNAYRIAAELYKTYRHEELPIYIRYLLALIFAPSDST